MGVNSSPIKGGRWNILGETFAKDCVSIRMACWEGLDG